MVPFAQSYDYNITLVNRKKNIIFFLRIELYWIEEFLKTWYPFTYGCIVPSLAILPSGSGEEYFLNYGNVFQLFC